MSSPNCFSFQASGHKFEPLDGVGILVIRLYCTRCGRVIPADQAYNTLMWQNVELPEGELYIEKADDSQPVH